MEGHIEEHSVWSGKASYKILTIAGIQGLLSMIFVVLLIVGVDMFFNIEQYIKVKSKTVVFYAVVILFFVTLLKLMIEFIKINSREYNLSSERFTLTTGFLNKRVDNLELYRINDIAQEQTFVQRIFEIGDVIIYSSDESTPTLKILNVAKYIDLKEGLRKNIEIVRANRIIETSVIEKGN